MSNIKNPLQSLLEKISFDLHKNTFTLINPRNPAESVIVPYPFSNDPFEYNNSLNNFQYLIYKNYNYAEDISTDTAPGEGEMWVPEIFEQRIEKDLSWQLESVESNSTVIARKHSERARIPDGSYYKIGKIKQKDTIHIITSRYLSRESEETDFSFIYIYGRYILKDEEGEDTIRFYFNLRPDKDAIEHWRTTLVHRLNDRAIPFNLKYIKQLKNYYRADAGVLYIQKNNFNLAAPIIRQAYNKLRYANAIRKDVPPFTKKILDGLGFAESPFERGVSFGMSISKKIAEGLFDYLKINNSLAFDISNAVNAITATQFNSALDTVFLNTGSKYSYDFDIFKKHQPYKYQPFPADEVFLRTASHFANVLKEKAIWLNNTRTWITYVEIRKPSILQDEIETGFRLVNDLERDGIEFFLQNFDSVVDNEQIALDLMPDKNASPKIHYKKDEIFDKIITMKHNAKTAKSDLHFAKEFEEKYLDIRFPIPNAYDNYEFCPTISHGLAFFGYFFLYMHCEFNSLAIPALDEFLNIV